jgi:S1-C subfamily serine protease
MLEPGSEGLRIASFAKDSAAQTAGLEVSDRIVSLSGEPVKDLGDVKLVLWNKRPGDRIRVGVKRGIWLFGPKEMAFEVILR